MEFTQKKSLIDVIDAWLDQQAEDGKLSGDVQYHPNLSGWMTIAAEAVFDAAIEAQRMAEAKARRREQRNARQTK